MRVEETPAGTLVFDFTEREYDAYLDGEVQRGSGLSVADFVLAYEAGELDDADPGIKIWSVCCASDRSALAPRRRTRCGSRQADTSTIGHTIG